jgi:hypothetical protein
MSQTKFNFGHELGFSFSQLTQKDFWIEETTYITSETNPLISPLFGIHGQMTIKRHFQLTLGLQYQMIGKRYHYQKEVRIPRDPSIPPFVYYTIDEWDEHKFQKLAFPLTVGYSLQISKVIKPSIFLGLRPNLIIKGNYYCKQVLYSQDNPIGYESENNYNPLNSDEVEVSIDRFTNQFLFGISTLVGQHIKIIFCFNLGQDLSYGPYSTPDGEEMKSLENKEFGISLIYLLNPLIKKESEKKKNE